MISFPKTPNSVRVPIFQTGCLKAEFDSTYPIHLNGIISQNEFQESINKINRSVSQKKSLLILAIVFCLSTVSGVILIIVGAIKHSESHYDGFPVLSGEITNSNSHNDRCSVLIGVGIGLGIIGMIFCAFGCLITQFPRVVRMRKVIAEESMKYASRSPIPCSWRLDTSSVWSQGYGYPRNNRLHYHLVIDIGRSVAPGRVLYQSKPVAPESTSIFERQYNYAPPLYFSTLAGFCSNCSAPKRDSSATFCASCGQ
ncbi:unnamed protein product [Rotaria sp. Silwood1]|nr:unnamed protein product [Rotaria sp. Silwood1]CAF1622677.1 unnamed protein product [Rotaria sp. Silwood1]CAF4733963.1 unnamed protein product [Rotaria sp. Silwood1]